MPLKKFSFSRFRKDIFFLRFPFAKSLRFKKSLLWRQFLNFCFFDAFLCTRNKKTGKQKLVCFDAFSFVRKMKSERKVCVFAAFLCIRNATAKLKVCVLNAFLQCVEHDNEKKIRVFDAFSCARSMKRKKKKRAVRCIGVFLSSAVF